MPDGDCGGVVGGFEMKGGVCYRMEAAISWFSRDSEAWLLPLSMDGIGVDSVVRRRMRRELEIFGGVGLGIFARCGVEHRELELLGTVMG